MKKVEDLAYQFEAKSAALEELSREDRAQIIMCCGSGKTYTQAMISNEFLEQNQGTSQVIICLVPNKGLIYQNARNYRTILGDKVDYLGVCSEQEKTENPDEEVTILDVTTNPEKIHSFASSGGKPKMIFTTYQSAETTRDGLIQEDGNQIPISLGNFDEAHRTSGDKDEDSQFAFALFEQNMQIDKRLFFTATPKIKNSRAVPELAMNDRSIYGRVVYNYPFSRAREEGRVSDYNLYVPVVRKSEVEELITSSGLSSSQQREAVSEIALQKILEETGQSRFLSYHRTIARSKSFASRMSSVLKDQGFTVRHIDGTVKSPERRKILAGLEEDNNLVTNAKALTEGVDAPGLQGLLFVDPKGSQVDVTQALGRATRVDPQDPGKVASIIAPVLIDDQSSKSIAEQASEQGFKNLFMVAEALRANDDTFNIHIRDKSREAGRTGEIPEFGSSFIKIIDASVRPVSTGGDRLSDLDLETIKDGISLVAFNSLKDKSAEKVGQLEAFVEEHGELPTAKSDPKLASFIQLARRNHKLGRMSEDDVTMFEEIPGWRWSRSQRSFQDNLNDLSKIQQEGKKIPSDTSSTLGKFVRKVRNEHARGTLSPDRAKDLDRLPGWLWSPKEFKLQENLDYFFERTHRAPSPNSLHHAEAALGRQLSRIEQEEASSKPSNSRRSSTFEDSILEETGLGRSFRLDEIKNSRVFLARVENPGDPIHRISGQFKINHDQKDGEPNVHFTPFETKDGKYPYFETGIRGKWRTFGLHASPEDLERIKAFPDDYRATVTLCRAGKKDEAFSDGAIKSWHSAAVNFGEKPGSESKISYLLARLRDRKISGRPAYTAQNIQSGEINLNQTATALNNSVKPMTVQHIRGLIKAVRKKALTQDLPGTAMDQLDRTPGFSWIEADGKSPRLSDTVKMITKRHGIGILSEPAARKGDAGLANSLKEVDMLVSSKTPSEYVRKELQDLKKNGLLLPLIVQKKMKDQGSKRQEGAELTR